MSALGVHAAASMAALPPLPRRHGMRIGPQAFLCVSCFLFQPPQHRIPWRILPVPQAPAVLTNMWMTLVPSGRCFTRWNRLVTIDERDVHSLWSRSTHGRPASVGTLYHHSGHTGDRVRDCAAPIYCLCAPHVVVTAAAALGQRDK